MGIHITVEAHGPSPRLDFTLGVLCERYGWTWCRSGDGGRPLDGDRASVRLRYLPTPPRETDTSPRGTVSVDPHGLLAAPAGSTACQVDWGHYRDAVCPTGTDPLAGAFYCLALLSEYASRPFDAHGRLAAASHPVYLAGHHRIPIADRLLGALAHQLHTAAGEVGRPTPVPEPSSATSDVDAPRALGAKPPLRRLAALIRGTASSLRYPSPGATLRQLRDTLSDRRDPFDTFGYMDAAARGRGLRQDLFTLVGYGTRLDPGFPHGHAAWREFWRKLPPDVRLGLHPSYYSSERPELLRAEKRYLEEALDAPVTASRQHFLRLRIPDTFRVLVACGIREDHTLMWADADGFRAGTARSFRWYDLEREEATALRLFPPHAMDVTARYYGGLSPKQAATSWRELAAEARLSGTALRCIWHNSNLGPWYGWWPWRAAYESSLDLSVFRDGRQLRVVAGDPER